MMNNKTTNKTSISEQMLDFNGKPNPMQGWECPRCGKINAPWKDQCNCKRKENNNFGEFKDNCIQYSNKDFDLNLNDFPKFINCNNVNKDPCKYCNNNPENGGSGLCNCALGDYKVTC